MTVTLDSVTLLWVAVVLQFVAIGYVAWNAKQARIESDIDHRELFEELAQKVTGINVRLVDIETDTNDPPPSKGDDDPMEFPNGWLAQAAAAERGEGVRS